MQAMRYNNKVLEKLEDDKWEPLTEKINKCNVAEQLREVLEKNEVVYLDSCCDREFVEKNKDIFYFGTKLKWATL